MPPLLKIVEDPPPSTVFVFLVDELRHEHATIASRCVTIEFGTAEVDVIEAALVAEGFEPGAARTAAIAADGSSRTSPTASPTIRGWPPAGRHGTRSRSGWDGSGAVGGGDRRGGPRSHRRGHGVPSGDPRPRRWPRLERREEQLGTRGSGRRDLEAHHRRVERLFRTEELRFGMATLAARYRDMATSSDERVDPLDAVSRITNASEAPDPQSQRGPPAPGDAGRPPGRFRGGVGGRIGRAGLVPCEWPLAHARVAQSVEQRSRKA